MRYYGIEDIRKRMFNKVTDKYCVQYYNFLTNVTLFPTILKPM